MDSVGIDEAGRGPLAGPLAVGVVRVPEGFDLLARFPGLNDSKQLSEKRRLAIYTELARDIREGILTATVCFSSAAMIDEKGVTYAITHALNRGIRKIAPEPQEVRVYLDGSLHAPKEYVQETVIGGDASVPAIMLASVVAKVARDRLMKKIDELYPEYGFAVHKGYGTKAHFAALEKHGTCPEHRQRFLQKFFEGK